MRFIVLFALLQPLSSFAQRLPEQSSYTHFCRNPKRWVFTDTTAKGRNWEELVLCEEAGIATWYHNYEGNKGTVLALRTLNHYAPEAGKEVFVVSLPNPRFKYKIYLHNRSGLIMEKIEGNLTRPYRKVFQRVD